MTLIYGACSLGADKRPRWRKTKSFPSLASHLSYDATQYHANQYLDWYEKYASDKCLYFGSATRSSHTRKYYSASASVSIFATISLYAVRPSWR